MDIKLGKPTETESDDKSDKLDLGEEATSEAAERLTSALQAGDPRAVVRTLRTLLELIKD